MVLVSASFTIGLDEGRRGVLWLREGLAGRVEVAEAGSLDFSARRRLCSIGNANGQSRLVRGVGRFLKVLT